MMKKEWIYIAVLGLAAIIMSFMMLRDTSADCVAVAQYVASGKGYLSNHERQIVSYLNRGFGDSRNFHYVEYYTQCLIIEKKAD